MLMVGAGGLAAQLFEDLITMDLPSVVFWSEQESRFAFIGEKYKIINTDDAVRHYFNTVTRSFVLCIGDMEPRRKMAARFHELGGEMETFIVPHSEVSAYARVGKGTMILRDVRIEPYVEIGAECLLNVQSAMAHESKAGDYSFIGPTAILSAGTVVGDSCMIGTGAIVLPKIRVGNEVVVAAGAVVTKNFGDRAVVSGVPAQLRFYKKPPYA